MPDLLIRDVPDDVLAALEAHARRLGLSRAEYVRRKLTQVAAAADSPVSTGDTLPPADSAFIDRGRGPTDRLGLAVAVCTLPWPGFVPDDVASAPPTAVARLAEQLRLDPEEIRSYGRRAKTRMDHLRLAAQYLGWRAPTTLV
jgi:hypothetical protein